MFQLRVTAPDGSTTTHALTRARCTVGRAPGNDIRVEDAPVSALHCAFEIVEGVCMLVERGSTNGTWLNGQRVCGPTRLDEGDRVYVGSFLFELLRVPAVPHREETPILRKRSASARAWRDEHGRLDRHAEEWDRAGRPKMLALRGRALVQARAWLKHATAERAREIKRLQRELIAASERVATQRATGRALGSVGSALLLGGLATAAIVLMPESIARDRRVGAAIPIDEAPEEIEESSEGFEPIVDLPEEEEDMDELGDVNAPIEHAVIPFETLGDIAMRYGVSVDDIAAWNYLNADAPDLRFGQELMIEAPTRRPLPQTKFDYEIERGEASWTVLADRFGVPATRLEAYNAGVELRPGNTIAVWIDPKPYAPVDPDAQIPDYTFGHDARSIGRFNNGRLVNGLQLPQSPLYTRRAPSIMYGSAFTIEKVTEAVAAFRRDAAYDGELILADISRQNGGHFDPHKSHQSGRDIDIWLPTLKGVYKRKYLAGGGERERKPMFEEVDWYALWGLVRALIQTGAVEDVFLDWRYQEFVYRAAVNMGATPEELDAWIQWPRPRTHGKGIFRHSKDHLSHIHVRFKCASWERDCNGERAKVVED